MTVAMAVTVETLAWELEHCHQRLEVLHTALLADNWPVLARRVERWAEEIDQVLKAATEPE